MSAESGAIDNTTTSASAPIYSTNSVTSDDGTTIGYRQFGHGPGLLLVPGGLMTSQNFMKLASMLADEFTVYVLDRRGRGLSGPFGDNYTIKKDCEDIDALLCKTDTHNVFGLSSGALISLQATHMLPTIHKVALYEPPLFSAGPTSPMAWTPRYDRELAQGKLAAAMVTIMKGTADPSFFISLPRFVLVPLITLAIRSGSKETQSEMAPLEAIIPTFQYDAQIVKEMEGTQKSFQALTAEVLLLGGSKSQAYLQDALDSLNTTLPHVQCVKFAGLGHLAADNDGQPERVAQELRRFFSESTIS